MQIDCSIGRLVVPIKITRQGSLLKGETMNTDPDKKVKFYITKDELKGLSSLWGIPTLTADGSVYCSECGDVLTECWEDREKEYRKRIAYLEKLTARFKEGLEYLRDNHAVQGEEAYDVINNILESK